MSLHRRAEVFARACRGVPYRYKNGPLSEGAKQCLVEGLNCQLLIHLAYRNFFDVKLPDSLRSSELYSDNVFLQERALGDFREGDVVFMGPSDLNPQKDPQDVDAKKLHLALVVKTDPNGRVMLMHTRPRRGIVVESIRKVRRLTKHGKKVYFKVFAIKGLKVHVSSFNNS